MKLLFVGLILHGVIPGKSNTDVFIQKYQTMEQCVYAAHKITEEGRYADGSHKDHRDWDYCVPVYGVAE